MKPIVAQSVAVFDPNADIIEHKFITGNVFAMPQDDTKRYSDTQLKPLTISQDVPFEDISYTADVIIRIEKYGYSRKVVKEYLIQKP